MLSFIELKFMSFRLFKNFVLCYRRMNLAFTLITLVTNLTVVSEVHILLFLHSS